MTGLSIRRWRSLERKRERTPTSYAAVRLVEMLKETLPNIITVPDIDRPPGRVDRIDAGRVWDFVLNGPISKDVGCVTVISHRCRLWIIGEQCDTKQRSTIAMWTSECVRFRHVEARDVDFHIRHVCSVVRAEQGRRACFG